MWSRAVSMLALAAILRLLATPNVPRRNPVAIRGNWFWTRAWRWFADGTVYLLLFISMTRAYLWWVLRAERRVGIALLGISACSLFGTVDG